MNNKAGSKSGKNETNVLHKLGIHQDSIFSSSSTIKKRGRRPKKIIDNKYESIVSDVNSESSNQKSAVILKLPICPPMIKTASIKTHQMFRLDDADDFESDSKMYNINGQCNQCNILQKENKELKQQIKLHDNYDNVNKLSKFYKTDIKFINIDTGNNYTLKKTNIYCRWDCHSYDNLPFPVPEVYVNGIYYFKYLCCSASCAMALNTKFIKDYKTDSRNTLIVDLYREFMGLSPDQEVNICAAADIDILKIHGGSLSIDEYREKTFNTCIHKEFIKYVPPIKHQSIVIEEKISTSNLNKNEDDLVIKRSKPRIKRKIMSAAITSSK